MTEFFPIVAHIDGVWVNTNERDAFGRFKQVRNMDRWREIAAERDYSRLVVTKWVAAAIADGWSCRPTYAGESEAHACTLERDGAKCMAVMRPNIDPKDPTDREGRLGGGELHCWLPDRLQVKLPLEYPGFQYFFDALVTCPHCHRGPNRPYFTADAPCTYCGPGVITGLPGNACENCMNTGSGTPELHAPVATQRYSFAGRCCRECAPALIAKHEQPGWCD